jgi:hypothetical protein
LTAPQIAPLATVLKKACRSQTNRLRVSGYIPQNPAAVVYQAIMGMITFDQDQETDHGHDTEGIYHGEQDQSLEWGIVQVSAPVILLYIASSLFPFEEL